MDKARQTPIDGDVPVPAKRGPKTGPETRQKLLDVAERLFAEQGIEVVSLRRIVDEAGVGLSQLNYHFGTKKDLLRATCLRKLPVLTEERFRMLDAAEQSADAEQLLPEILRAYLLPCFRMYANNPSERNFLLVTSRVGSGSSTLSKEVAIEVLDNIQQRFATSLKKALPDLSTAAVYWRLQLILCFVIQTPINPDRIKALSGGVCDPLDVDALMDAMMPVLIAAFRAPESSTVRSVRKSASPGPAVRPATKRARVVERT